MMNKEYCKGNRIWLTNVVLLVCFILYGFTAVPSLQAAVEASATLTPRSFPIDRVAAFNITIKGVRSFQPVMPEVEGIQFHRRGSSTQMEIINGSYSSSVTLTYLVQAEHVGNFTIPAIKISTKEGNVRTPKITFEVTDSQTANAASRPQAGGRAPAARLRSGEGQKLAFLRVIPVKKKSYLGEVVPVQIKVYFRDGLKANLNSLPQLQGDGYVLQQLGREPVQTREQVNSIPYSVLSWDSALSGIKEGAHDISMEIDATLLLPEQRRSSSPLGNSMFNDPFFSNFFTSYEEKDVKVASPAMKLQVLPLPAEGRPADFSGAIGDFRLSVSANPVELAPGDPITLTMTVSGQGNFDRVQAPKLSATEGWKAYSPSSEFLKDGGLGLGKKVFEQALVAKDSSLREIPAILFSYFDPSAATYKTLTAKPIPLNIKGTAAGVVKTKVLQKEQPEQKENGVAESTQKVKEPLDGLAPLQLDPTPMDQELSPLFARKWFQILSLLLLLLVAIAVVMKIRATRYASDPRLQRARAMKHLLEVRVTEIDKALNAHDTRGFLESCRKTIQEQLGLVWDVEAGAITLADLEKRLPEDSIILEVFGAADESAYGGQELNQGQMQDFYDRLKNDLEGLT